MKRKCDSSKGNGCEITRQKLFIIRKQYRSEDPLGSREKMGGEGAESNKMRYLTNQTRKIKPLYFTQI